MVTSWTWLSRSPAAVMDEPGLFLQLAQIGGAAVAHPAAQAADQLLHHGRQRPAVGHARLDSLGDVFAAALAVAVGRTGFHGAERAHAAVGLEGAALVEDRLAGSFFGAGQQAAEHDGG